MKKVVIYSFALMLAALPALAVAETAEPATDVLAPADSIGRPAADTDNNLLRAALRGWHVNVGAGFEIGGTSPLPLPRSIRKIESFNPLLNLYVEGIAHKKFTKHWGLATGLRFEIKGMKTKANVKDYHMEMTADDGGFMEGAWTGHVETKVRNTYLTLPVLATYTFNNDRWQVSAGPYVSVLLDGGFSGAAYDGYIRHHDPTGEKAYVTHATYNFSHDVRRWAWGLQVGGQFRAYKHLLVKVNLDWGFNSIFPADFESVTFKLYPIYGTLGFAYDF